MEFSYDPDPSYNYRIVQVRDNIGRTVGYTYDASGRLWKVTDVNGGVTEYTYDGASRMLTVKDPRGIVYLTNEYDANGRVFRQTQADNTTYQFAYTLDGTGSVTQTDPMYVIFAIPDRDYLAMRHDVEAGQLKLPAGNRFKTTIKLSDGTAFPTIGGVTPGIIPGIAWSDHWAFAELGFQAVMVTDTALFRYPHYHRPSDTPDKVDTEKVARVVKGIERVIRDFSRGAH